MSSFERLPLDPSWLYPNKTVLSAADFYKTVLTSLEARTGLIHGRFNSDDGVCAMGAVVEFLNPRDEVFSTQPGNIKSLQEANDSVPRATPEERLNFVRDWLNKKIQALTS